MRCCGWFCKANFMEGLKNKKITNNWSMKKDDIKSTKQNLISSWLYDKDDFYKKI